MRPVRCEHEEFSRDELSTSTRNSLGSILGLFLLPETAEADVLRVIGRASSLENVSDIEADPKSEDNLLRDVEARSIEFIKDRVVRLNWQDMQELVAGLLRAMGYKTRVSPAGPDRGKDIVASPDGFGFENPRIVVEVKHRPNSTMGSPEIRSFLGGRHPGDKGLYVSTGGLSREAHYEAERANIPVTLMGLDELVALIVENYENMDNETQRLVPLKRIYWPIQ